MASVTLGTLSVSSVLVNWNIGSSYINGSDYYIYLIDPSNGSTVSSTLVTRQSPLSGSSWLYGGTSGKTYDIYLQRDLNGNIYYMTSISGVTFPFYVAPTLCTIAPTTISSTSITFNVTVGTAGQNTRTNIYYGTTNITSLLTQGPEVTSSGTYTLSSLTLLTTYYYQLRCVSTSGTATYTNLTTTAGPITTLMGVTGVVTNETVSGATDGSIAMPTITGGTAPYTYSWGDSGVTTGSRTGLAAGSYTLTVTDAAAKTGSATYTVGVKPAVTLTPGAITKATAYNATNGAIAATTVAGGGTYTYAWSDGAVTTSSRTALTPGTYILTVTEAQGNTNSYTFVVGYTFVVTATVVTNVSVSGGSDGAVNTPTVTGALAPLTYLWSTGATASSISGLVAGSYTVTVTDANGVVQTSSSITVTNKVSITAVGAVTYATIGATGTGAIAAPTVTLGTLPYVYSWADSAVTTSSRSSLFAGTYTLTVADASAAPNNTATYTYTVYNNNLQINSYYDNVSGSAWDTLGASVAISGSYCVAGAPSSSVVYGTGSATFLTFVENAWGRPCIVAPADGAIGDTFGYSVAISGDNAFVGAPVAGGNTGAVYVYTRDTASTNHWTQTSKLVGASAGDKFGYLISMSGNYAAICSYTTYKVDVYILSGSSWEKQFTLTPSTPTSALSLSGDYLVIGSSSARTVSVYFRSGVTWNLQATLVPGTGATGDGFGTSVSTDGSSIVVGSPYYYTNTGTVHVFLRTGVTWSQQAVFQSPVSVTSNTYFGWAVAIYGDFITVSTHMQSSSTADYVAKFYRKGVTWSASGDTSTYGSIGDNFGYALAMNGAETIISASNASPALSSITYSSQGTGSDVCTYIIAPFSTNANSYNHTGTLSADYGSLWAATSKNGIKCVYIPSGKYITYTSISINYGGPWEISLWVYPTVFTASTILSNIYSTVTASLGGGIRLDMDTSGYLKLYGFKSATASTAAFSTLTSSTPLILNAWNVIHIGNAGSTRVITMYLNNTSVGSVTSTATYNYTSSWNPFIMYLGRTDGVSSPTFQGYVSNLIIGSSSSTTTSAYLLTSASTSRRLMMLNSGRVHFMTHSGAKANFINGVVMPTTAATPITLSLSWGSKTLPSWNNGTTISTGTSVSAYAGKTYVATITDESLVDTVSLTKAVVLPWNTSTSNFTTPSTASLSSLGQSVSISGSYCASGQPGFQRASMFYKSPLDLTWGFQTDLCLPPPTTGTAVGTQAALATYIYTSAPWGSGSGFADTSAYWLWPVAGYNSSVPQGYTTFYSSWSQAATTDATIHVLADNAAHVYLNDVYIGGVNDALTGVTTYPKFCVPVSAGTNTIKIQVYNTSTSSAGLLASVIENATETVLIRTTSAWTCDAVIDPKFGYSIALSGDYAIIGTNIATGGFACIYKKSASGLTWSYVTKFSGDSTSGAYFGKGVAVSSDGSNAAVSAVGVGKVYVYARSGDAWSLSQTISGSTTFGYSISMSGTSDLAISETEAGKVHVYTRSGTTWSLQQTIASSNFDGFGTVVSIDSDYLAIASPFYMNSSIEIYARSNGYWISSYRMNANTLSISSIHLNGIYLAVGSSSLATIPLFVRSGATWAQIANFTTTTVATSVAIDSKSLFVGTASMHKLYCYGAELTCSAPTIVHPTAAGTANGSITVTVTGGAYPYTYAWNNGVTSITGSTGSVLNGGTYTLKVTDASGTVLTKSFTLVNRPTLVATRWAPDVQVNSKAFGSSASFDKLYAAVIGLSSKKVYIYAKDAANRWYIQQMLGSSTATYTYYTVSISNDYLVASIADGVVTYKRSGSMWMEQTSMKLSAGSSTSYGRCTSTSHQLCVRNDKLIVGDYVSSYVYAYIYTLVGGLWANKVTLPRIATSATSRFSVAIDGNLACYGAPFYLSGYGAVNLCAYVNQAWVVTSMLGSSVGYMGTYVSLSGDTALVLAASGLTTYAYKYSSTACTWAAAVTIGGAVSEISGDVIISIPWPLTSTSVFVKNSSAWSSTAAYSTALPDQYVGSLCLNDTDVVGCYSEASGMGASTAGKLLFYTLGLTLSTAVTAATSYGASTGSIVPTVLGASGQGAITYKWSDGLTTTTATRSNVKPGSYGLVVTDGSGATLTDTIVVPDYYSLSTTLASPQQSANTNFGDFSAVDGNWAMVSCYGYDSPSTDCGCVCVYENIGGTWTQQATPLQPLVPVASEGFGYKISLVSDRAMITCYNTANVYIFHLVDSTWTQKALKTEGRWFQGFPAICGDFAAIGNPSGDGNVYAYSYDGSTWSSATALVFTDPLVSGSDGRGISIGMYEDTLVVGSYMDAGETNAIASTGAVYIFKRSGSTWTQTQKSYQCATITATAPTANMYYGDYMATGGNFGAVCNCATTSLMDIYDLISGEMGCRVSIPVSTVRWVSMSQNGRYVVVGAGTSILVYIRSSSDKRAWSLCQTLTAQATNEHQSISNDGYLFAGSSTISGNIGNAKVYKVAQISYEPGLVTKVSATGGVDGAIAAGIASGGIAPYTYLWSSGEMSSSLSDKAAGDYTLTITDSTPTTPLTASYTYTIDTRPQITFTPGAVQGTSASATARDGSIAASTVSVTAGALLSYTWSDGYGVSAVAPDLSRCGLARGIYTLTVSEAQGASVSAAFDITTPLCISSPGIVTNVSATGLSDGTITGVIVIGTSTPFTYAWSDGVGATTLDRNGLVVGAYTLTITDSLLVTVMYTYTVGTKPAVTLTPGAITKATSYDGATGSIATTTVAGGGIYTYAWSDGTVTTTSRSALVSGSYTLTVTEVQGNTASTTFTVGYTFTVSGGTVVNEVATGSSDGSISSPTVTGALAPLSYLWSNGAITSTITELATGAYSVTVTDANGVSATSAVYTVGTKPTVTLTPGAITKATAYNTATGAIATTTIAGGGIYTYAWSDGAVTTSSRSALVPGSYTLTVTEAQGNIASYTFVVGYTFDVTAGRVIGASAAEVADGSIAAPMVTGTLGPFTFEWI